MFHTILERSRTDVDEGEWPGSIPFSHWFNKQLCHRKMILINGIVYMDPFNVAKGWSHTAPYFKFMRCRSRTSSESQDETINLINIKPQSECGWERFV